MDELVWFVAASAKEEEMNKIEQALLIIFLKYDIVILIDLEIERPQNKHYARCLKIDNLSMPRSRFVEDEFVLCLREFVKEGNSKNRIRVY